MSGWPSGRQRNPRSRSNDGPAHHSQHPPSVPARGRATYTRDDENAKNASTHASPAGPSPSHHLLRSERVPPSPDGSAPELIPVPVPSTSNSKKPAVFVTAGQYATGL